MYTLDELKKVSVPLRGYFFEIIIEHVEHLAENQFPSPYGDIFLK